MKIPTWMFPIVNPIVATLLRSPLHGMMSNDVMLLIVTGRKSGKKYTMPVSYLRDGDKLRCFTGRAGTWWRNLRGGADVRVLVQGSELAGRGEAITDPPERVGGTMEGFLARLPRDAVYYEVSLDAQQKPVPADVARAVPQAVLIEVTLAPGA